MAFQGHNSTLPRRAPRVAGWIAAAAFGTALAVTGATASPALAAEATSLTGIILGVGADESQRIVSWYSSADTAQRVQLAPSSTLVAGEFPASAATFSALGSANVTTGYNRHATLTGLQENTVYSYRVGSAADGWSDTYSFKTQSFDGEYDFLFFGDPQIGAGNITSDAAGWANTLNVALTANPDTEILVSGGDQVETANNEAQWDAFLAPDELRQYPWAATIGNHDVGGKAYEQHLFTPNTDRSASYYVNGNPSSNTSGGDYWYIYKDVLFIDLNSNSYVTTNGEGGDAAHVAYVTDVINQHGAEAKYTILVYHHSIYSGASHAKDSDNKQRRQDFTTAFSDLGVDLVLQGHDHVYTRSYELKNGVKANADEQPGAADVFVGEGGVIYMTANSASGSKYYGITSPDSSGTGVTGYGADPLQPGQYWFNSVQSQENAPSYVKVSVRSDELVVQSLRSTATANGGVNSTIDSVTIHPYYGENEEIQVTVPDAAPGEFGWTIDGHNGLVDLGTAVEKDNSYFEASGEINPIVVTDTRRSQAPWSVSASVGDFRDGVETFSGSFLGWTPKVADSGAGAVAGTAVASGFNTSSSGLSVSRVLGSAAQGHDKGEATLGADLSLKIPSEVAKGSYRTTLTLTALAG